MSEFGQALTPKTFHRREVRAYTKLGFTELICKALLEVGMKPIPSWDSYDIYDPANAEKPVDVNGTDLAFWFDFPDSSTFVLNGVLYRPCVAISASVQADPTGFAHGNVGEVWGIKLCYRRGDRLVKSDVRNLSYYRGNTNRQGLGTFGEFNFIHWTYEAGSFYYDPTWRPYASFVNVNYAPKYLNNIFVHLGPAGLVVLAGTGDGTRKSDFANVIAWTAVFAGSRIPGRARVPLQDPNLSRIDPVMAFPMKSVDTDYVSGTGELRSHSLGMQHDMKYTQEPVVLAVYNLENVEQPPTAVAGCCAPRGTGGTSSTSPRSRR